MFRTAHETRKRIVDTIILVLGLIMPTLMLAVIARDLDEKHTKPMTCYDVLAAGYIDQRDEYYMVVHLGKSDPFTAYSKDPLVRYYIEEIGHVENPRLAFALWGDLSNPTVWYIRDLTTCAKSHEPSAGS